MAQVRWTLRAVEDLHEIHDFIATDSPRSASAFVDRLLESVERLALFPESGRVVPESPSTGHREIIVAGYRILYRRAGETVWIATVIHGRRLLDGRGLAGS